MKAFIVKLSGLLKLDTGKNTGSNNDVNFDCNKRVLKIPLYQREYKWTDEKITTFINDILKRDKFIGNVILDENDDCYEIVDGQQRITTCFLTIVCLYNLYTDHQLDQDRLNKLLRPYANQFILKNDSIGEYIVENEGLLKLVFDASDVYFQKDDFNRALKKINELLSNINQIEFLQKLLDCEILVLINNQHDHTRPVEQLFLDINEKAQLLDVEDIFKGHCFENYSDDALHKDLRALWVELKKCGVGFKKFGFEDLSEYIYLFLLLKENSDIPEKLTIAGKHYLDGKTMDQTKNILSEMNKFGSNILLFENNINRADYRFIDLCSDASRFQTTDDHLCLKQMCFDLLNSKAKAKYQKLPFMYLISFLLTGNNSKLLQYDQFKKIITNVYIFAYLFTLSSARKSKKNVDQTLKTSLNTLPFNPSDVVQKAKDLRSEKVSQFNFNRISGYEPLSFVYSIIDNYSANENWLSKRYTRESGYNYEHLLINDNKGRRVTWVLEDSECDFQITQSIVVANKKKITNYLVIPEDLNESLEHKDIVEKIRLISNWFTTRTHPLPMHLSKIINFIKGLESYKEIERLKAAKTSDVDIIQPYCAFLDEYFNDEKQGILCCILEEEFKKAFEN